MTNCDSFINKRSEMQVVINDQKPLILILTEVFPKNYGYDLDMLSFRLEDYELFLSDLGRGRGVAIHVHKSIRAARVQISSDNDFKEAVWCSIRLEKGDNLLIGAIYRSPTSTSDNNNNLNVLINQALSLSYSHVLIAGDFNYKEIDWEDIATIVSIRHEASIFLECIKDSGLTQHILSPTRTRENQKDSILDLLFTNEEGMVDSVQIMPAVGASDHNTIFFNLVCYIPKSVDETPRPNFFKGDYEAMRENLNQQAWEFGNCKDVNEMWSSFTNRLDHLIREHVPMKRTKTSFKKKWMTVETAAAIDRKRRAWVKYLNCRNNENYSNYCRARNAATTCIKYAKRDYERSISNKAKTDPKLFWSYVKANTKTREQVGDLRDSDGELSGDPQIKAGVLNDFFSSVFTRESTASIPELDSRCGADTFANIHVTPDDVQKVISKLNASKSPGPDGIHNKLLLELRDSLSYPLADIFNKSLESGMVPDGWKVAHVTPIFKSGDKHSASNYRPVSLTSVCGRILETIVKGKLMHHMESNKLFSINQHGFRGGHSCVTQLITVVEEWTRTLDEGKPIDVIYLDFRKAFDTVPHMRLMNKLKAYGVGGDILNWIGNFLKDRKQRVVLEGKYSEWADVVSGIPQGSVLGPVLFLVFINDLPDEINNIVKIFADDTKLYSPISDATDFDSLQDDLDRMAKWSDKWKLGFNAKKCKCMNIGASNPEHTYTMLDPVTQTRTNIEQVSEEKDLGVTFQDDLKFTKHVNNCVKKANRMIGIIKEHLSSLTETCS